MTLFSFNPPEPAPPAPLLSSLLTLKGALPVGRAENSSLRKTAGALSDVTGFIAAQTYTLPPNYRFSATGYSALSPEEEEVRREIRALKGLVLNRCVRTSLALRSVLTRRLCAQPLLPAAAHVVWDRGGREREPGAVALAVGCVTSPRRRAGFRAHRHREWECGWRGRVALTFGVPGSTEMNFCWPVCALGSCLAVACHSWCGRNVHCSARF